jgi:hypothetical protein
MKREGKQPEGGQQVELSPGQPQGDKDRPRV